MSEFPSEQEQLFQQIENPTGGTHGREAARAKLDALLAREFTASLARLSTGMEHATRVVGESLAELAGELVRTRNQMAVSSVVASRHQRALIAWTAVLSLATIAYAAAAFLPFFERSFATSPAADRAWVLWGEGVRNGRPFQVFAIDSFTTLRDCKAESEKLYRHPDPRRSDVVSTFCLPDTVDPHGPKGK